MADLSICVMNKATCIESQEAILCLLFIDYLIL